MIREEELVVGACYFEIGYAEASLKTPVIKTYRYMGRDLIKDEEGVGYYFRFFPSRWLPEEFEGLEEEEEMWRQKHPEVFEGVGAPVPLLYAFDDVRTLFSLVGLIAERHVIEGLQSRGSTR